MSLDQQEKVYKFALETSTYQNEDVFEKIKDNAKEFINEIDEDIPMEEYEKGMINFNIDNITFDSIKNMFWLYRWLLNALFIGLPWFAISILGMLYNIYFNIVFNRIWAGGNWWLILNSLVAFG